MAHKITIFEPHFDGAIIGPSTSKTAEETMPDSDEMAETSVESPTGSRLRPMLGIVGLIASVMISRRVIRRFRSADSDDLEIQLDESSDATVAETQA